MNIKHDAFISYSHRADGELGKALEEGLEKLAKPLLTLRAIDIFRDETSLAANPSLWTGILHHLSGAAWLVVLASPEWASSAWCYREALWWLENRSADRMLIVVTGGELVWDAATNDFDWTVTTALHEVLRGKFHEEPLYVDLRWARGLKGLTLRNLRFREAVLSLSAAIREMRKDELDGADVRQMRRNRRFVQAGVTAIAIAAVVAIWQAIVATQQRDEAMRQTRIALSRALAALTQQKLAGDEEKTDVALLVATRAMKLDAGPTARAALLAALQKHPRLHRLLWDGPGVHAVEFSADGSRLASAAREGAVSIWETSTGKLLRRIPDAHRDSAWALAFLPDGKRIITASLDKTIAIWDVESGNLVGNRMTGHADQILSLALSRDGRTAATACLDGSVWLWDLERRQAIRKLDEVHTGGARAVAFGPDGTTLVTGGFDGMIKVWDALSGEALPGPDRAHDRDVLRVAYNRAGDVLASAAGDGSVRLWDTRTWKPLFRKPFNDHSLDVTGLAFSPDGRELASGGWNNRIIVWRLGKSEDETSTHYYEYQTSARYYEHQNTQVWQVAFSPDGRLLAAASSDGTISLWDARGSVGFKSELADYPEAIHGLAIDSKSSLLALGAPDGKVYLHTLTDLNTPGKASDAQILQGQQDEVLALAFSDSGALLASTALDGTIAIWDMRGNRSLLWKTTLPGVAIFDFRHGILARRDDASHSRREWFADAMGGAIGPSDRCSPSRPSSRRRLRRRGVSSEGKVLCFWRSRWRHHPVGRGIW